MLFIIQNDPEVPAGTYGAYIEDRGIPCSLVRPYLGEPLPSPDQVSAAIVLGGAMGVHEIDKHPFLGDLKRFIRETVNRKTPFFGICLGGQLLADVLGAQVIAGSPCGEKGTLDVQLTETGKHDPLFNGIAQSFVTFQWHNDSFEIPEGGLLLASSQACPNQAFRFGNNAYATQFHPEVNRTIVEIWAKWTEETAPHLESYLREFDLASPLYEKASRKILANFLAIAKLA
ncbi:MAG: type 1 glutamine amidotransferase [Geobacter sp.]|nr:type 1 glutamine amidotransferase [Geobacter sp.]